MNRYLALLTAFIGAILILGSAVESHGATKKKKKPVAEESADDDAATPAPKHGATPKPKNGASPAPKKSATSGLDLPLPSKSKSKGKSEGESTPAPEKSTDGEKPKTGDKSATSDKATAPEGEATPRPKKSEKASDKTGDPTEKTDKAPEKSTEKTGTEAKAKPEHAPNATVEPEQIADFAAQPPRVQQVIRDAVDLTRLNLTYTFGSADPDSGGMDCSGTIYYLLRAHNLGEIPRDSSGQYLWARKNGAFFPVVSKSAESVEFKELQPGDLMFWTGTYETGRDVPISHVMMYLGREKGSGKRIMFGASDGRSYNGVQRWGVSVFDFKMPNANSTNPEKAKVEFVGYARIPGLRAPGTPGSAAPLVAEQEKQETAEAPKKEAAAATPAPSTPKKTGSKTAKKKKKVSED